MSASNIYHSCLVRIFHVAYVHGQFTLISFFSKYINISRYRIYQIYMLHYSACSCMDSCFSSNSKLHAIAHIIPYIYIYIYPIRDGEDKLKPLAGVSSDDPGIQATWISTSWRARRAYHAAKSPTGSSTRGSGCGSRWWRRCTRRR